MLKISGGKENNVVSDWGMQGRYGKMDEVVDRMVDSLHSSKASKG